MSDKLNVRKVSFSLTYVSAIVYIVCAVLIAVAPEWTVKVFGYLFHGIDINQIATTPALSGTIIGFIEIIVLAWIFGWLYAKIYNKLE